MGKQFIERNQVVIGIVAAVLLVLAVVVSLSLTRQDIAGGYTVVVEFADANGLRPGDVAVVAGIRAGTVREIEIVDDHVEARVQMDGDVELPATTRAEITLRTLVGKRGVVFDTGSDFSGAMLADGDRIGLDRTTVTVDVPQLAESADDLLGEIDSDALNMLLVNVADVTRGQRERIADLVDSGTDLTELVNSQETQIRQLLRNLSQVGETLESRDDELVGIIDDLDVALGNLAARRADLQELLAETQRTGALTADFVIGIREDLDAILDELHLDLEIINRHQVDLAEGLAYAGSSLVGFSSIGFANGEPVEWGHVFVNALGPANVDVILGCGGILDQQLDELLGPDPRSCEEQTNQTLPDDAPNTGDDDSLIPDLPVLTGDGPVELEPQRLPIDVGPRSLIEALEAAPGGEE